MNTLIEQLNFSFETYKEEPALEIGTEIYTYEELWNLAVQIRTLLHGVAAQNIGVYLTDDVFMYASLLAIWLEGKTYVPVHPGFPAAKNEAVIAKAELSHILSSIQIDEDFPPELLITKNLTAANEHVIKNVSASTNAYILFTSGSTGEPKGVPITYQNLEFFAKSFDETFGKLKPDDRVLQMFDLTFDLSVMSFLMPWLHGACVVALHRKETKFLQILDLLEANQITVALMVPSMLNLLIPYLDPQIQNSSLRLNLFCGEPLLTKQIKNWKSFVLNSAIYNVYGPTENTIFCSYYELKDAVKEQNGIVAIGSPMPYTEMSIDDGKNNEGELLLSGKFLTEGYWKNPKKNSEVFFIKNGIKYYRTGDYCKKDEDGIFYYLQRIDFQAKINGYRIELPEIEYFANELFPNIVTVAMVSKDENDNDYLALFVNDLHIEEQILQEKLKNLLPEYSVPSRIVKLAQFPQNSSGKTDRKALKEMLQ